jgi:hypothetical protein
LIERELEGALIVESAVLGLWWIVAPEPTLGTLLRLARDEAGRDLLPTLVEAVEARARVAEEAAEHAREAAERRIRELENELSRRDGPR